MIKLKQSTFTIPTDRNMIMIKSTRKHDTRRQGSMATDLLTFISGVLITEEQKMELSLYNEKKEIIREHLIFLKRIEQPTRIEKEILSRENEKLNLSEGVFAYLENEEFQQLLVKNDLNFVKKSGKEEFTLVKDSKERKHRLKRFTDLYSRSVEVNLIEKMEHGYKVEYKKIGSFFPNYTHTLLFNEKLQGTKYQLYHPQWKTLEEDQEIEEFTHRNPFNQEEVERVAQILKEHIDHD